MTVAVSDGVSVFLNNHFITSDAFYEKQAVYVNYIAVVERLGISSDAVAKYSIRTLERNDKIYLNLNEVVKHDAGKLKTDNQNMNSYISLNTLTVNGAFLSRYCGGFDKEYLMEISDLSKMGYTIKEDKDTITLFDKKIAKTERENKRCVNIEDIAKALGYQIKVDSLEKAVEIKIPAILKYGLKTYKTIYINNRLFIKEKDAFEIDDSINVNEKYHIHKLNSSAYVDLEELLTDFNYKANEFLTVIELQKKEKQ
jgi:hypothetical protein